MVRYHNRSYLFACRSSNPPNPLKSDNHTEKFNLPEEEEALFLSSSSKNLVCNSSVFVNKIGIQCSSTYSRMRDQSKVELWAQTSLRFQVAGQREQRPRKDTENLKIHRGPKRTPKNAKFEVRTRQKFLETRRVHRHDVGVLFVSWLHLP